MINLKKVMFVYVLVVAVLIAPAVYAQKGDEDSTDKSSFFQKRRDMMDKKISEIYAQLNLDDDQKAKLEENKQKHRGGKRGVFEKMKSYKDALNQELMKPDLDMNTISGIQSQIKALQSQMVDERLNSILEVRKILTPDQFTKFITMMEKHKREASSDKE